MADVHDLTGPLVGVIVPCFNQGHFAAACVESILRQSYPRLKAVVINDASTDDSARMLEALRGPRVEVIHLERNLGRALVRNEAVRRLGEVDYVLNVDCDDVLSETYIEKLVGALEAEPESGLAYGLLRFFGEPATDGKTWPERAMSPAERFLENTIPGPGVLFRAAALKATSGWRVEFTHQSGEDYDIWLQVVNAGWKVSWVRDAIYHYRQHPASFLARSTTWTQVEVKLTILGCHSREIRRSCGTRAFLEPQVMPEFYDAVHSRDLSRARRILHVLVRHAPFTALGLAVGYYAGRVFRR
jgi:glycosyltransferase involved in cell wall biosynthesis